MTAHYAVVKRSVQCAVSGARILKCLSSLIIFYIHID